VNSILRNGLGESYAYAYLSARSDRDPTAEQVSIDSIQVLTIPEPASALLFVLAGSVALRRTRRTR
jgi:hypothetical protein